MEQLSLFDEETIAQPGWDHAALVLVPHALAQRSTQPVTIQREVCVEGRKRRVAVTLVPGAGQELPSHLDGVLLLALLQLTLHTDNRERVEFKRAQVLDLLGWSDEGRAYRRMRDGLRRLTEMTVRVESALVARDGRPYQLREGAAHIVEAYDIRDGYDSTCVVTWGEVVRQGLLLDDVKRLDWSLLLRLDNPLTVQLYRLLDRATLSGERTWSIDWSTLADLLGMSSEGYARPARFHQVLRPHIERLIAERVLEGYEYQRGGVFRFSLTNYLRSSLRRLLAEHGVYPDLARQLVAGYDEVRILQQLDCLAWRDAREPAGLLAQSIREGYLLDGPVEEAESFAAVWGLLMDEERRAYWRAGAKLLGDEPAHRVTDPAKWPFELRSVVRCLLNCNLDPELV